MSKYFLTTEHAASSYGQPVLVDHLTGRAFGVSDVLPDGRPAIELYRELLGLPASAGPFVILRGGNRKSGQN